MAHLQGKGLKHILTLGFLFTLSLSFLLSRADSVEFIYLTAGGKSMAPTISAGQTVKIKIGYDGAILKAGFQNSSHPGDIIVYGTIVALSHIPRPKSMWICHRVVEKYAKNGSWYFRTMGDNNPQIDPWKVPGHFVLGVVVEIGCLNPTISRQKGQTMKDLEPTFSLNALGDLAVGIVFGLTVGVITIEIHRYNTHIKSRKLRQYT